MSTPESPELVNEVQLTTEERVARIERILGIQADGSLTGSDELLVLVSGQVSTLFNSPRAAQQLALGVLNQATQSIAKQMDVTDSGVDLILIPTFLPGSLKVVMDPETREVSFFEKADPLDVDPEGGWVTWSEVPSDPIDLAEIVRLVVNLGLEPSQAKFLITRAKHDAFLRKVSQAMASRNLAKTAVEQAVAKKQR